MKRGNSWTYIVIVIALIIVSGITINHTLARQGDSVPSRAQTALGTAFTYQGQLKDDGTPVNGDYDFQFILYDAVAGGSQIAGTTLITKTAIPVSDGLFTVALDFGNIFENNKLYLEVGVRPGSSTGSYTILSPRQEITPAPYAQYAVRAGSALSIDSVPWTDVTDKPEELFKRSIYITGEAFNRSSTTDIETSKWGIRWQNTTATGGFVMPQPADWDKSTPFTVTLYFAIPSAATPGTICWRLRAGSCKINTSGGTGWDSLNYYTDEDAELLTYTETGGYSYVTKSQSWVSKRSGTSGSWHFGDSVTTNNNFSGNPIWHFNFQRG
ncbi:MAG: hypothetical protein JW981_01295, partial [Anaerolineae bacterium]|nr:hypothetical protein [Anaerolineae bacterium]